MRGKIATRYSMGYELAFIILVQWVALPARRLRFDPVHEKAPILILQVHKAKRGEHTKKMV